MARKTKPKFMPPVLNEQECIELRALLLEIAKNTKDAFAFTSQFGTVKTKLEESINDASDANSTD